MQMFALKHMNLNLARIAETAKNGFVNEFGTKY